MAPKHPPALGGTPHQSLMSPPVYTMKSPLQRRWSQFKESHPDDFAQDVERKRLRDAQMESFGSDAQDIDLRGPPTQKPRELKLPPLDPNVPIPKVSLPEWQHTLDVLKTRFCFCLIDIRRVVRSRSSKIRSRGIPWITFMFTTHF